MNFAILGTGSFGRAMGKLFSAKDVGVVYGSRNVEDGLTKLPGAEIVPLRDAIQKSSLVLLAIPAPTALDILSSCGPLEGKTLIDAINPVNADWSPMHLRKHLSMAEALQDAFPRASVVKAFNNIFADVIHKVLDLPRSNRPTVFIAGSHDGPKALVKALVDRLDLPAIDAGRIENARYLEAMAHLNIQLARAAGYGTSGSFKYS